MLVMLILSIMMIDVQTGKHPEAVNGRSTNDRTENRLGQSLGPASGRFDAWVARPQTMVEMAADEDDELAQVRAENARLVGLPSPLLPL
jgi:hypothetical protein